MKGEFSVGGGMVGWLDGWMVPCFFFFLFWILNSSVWIFFCCLVGCRLPE